MRAGRWQIGVTLWLVLCGISAAAAQEVVRAPEQIRNCLCQERSVGALNTEVQAQSRAYEDKRQAFQALDKQVQTTRPSVNVAKQADVDAFKRLLEQRDRAADDLASTATKSYSDAVARYNQAVAAYNGNCAGKSYDADQLADMRRNLSCPKQ
jgi:predicted  nucleic acid-binding Zn-ribbon protein